MKKIILISIIAFMMLFFIACGQIEDTNGNENTDLCQITMDQITGVKHSFASVKTVTNTNLRLKCGGEYNKIFGINEDEDVDYIKFKGGPSSGTQVFMATKLDEEQKITLDVSFNIESGNMQLFLLSPTKEIIYEFENETESYDIIAKEHGVYLLMLGAESFVGQIEVERYFE